LIIGGNNPQAFLFEISQYLDVREFLVLGMALYGRLEQFLPKYITDDKGNKKKAVWYCAWELLVIYTYNDETENDKERNNKKKLEHLKNERERLKKLERLKEKIKNKTLAFYVAACFADIICNKSLSKRFWKQFENLKKEHLKELLKKYEDLVLNKHVIKIRMDKYKINLQEKELLIFLDMYKYADQEKLFVKILIKRYEEFFTEDYITEKSYLKEVLIQSIKTGSLEVIKFFVQKLFFFDDNSFYFVVTTEGMFGWDSDFFKGILSEAIYLPDKKKKIAKYLLNKFGCKLTGENAIKELCTKIKEDKREDLKKWLVDNVEHPNLNIPQLCDYKVERGSIFKNGFKVVKRYLSKLTQKGRRLESQPSFFY
jgi:hypothetical protein